MLSHYSNACIKLESDGVANFGSHLQLLIFANVIDKEVAAAGGDTFDLVDSDYVQGGQDGQLGLGLETKCVGKYVDVYLAFLNQTVVNRPES